MHVSIRRMGKTLLCFAFGVELNKVEGNFLNLGLGLFLKLIPRIAAYLIYLGHSAFLAGKLAYFM